MESKPHFQVVDKVNPVLKLGIGTHKYITNVSDEPIVTPRAARKKIGLDAKMLRKKI